MNYPRPRIPTKGAKALAPWLALIPYVLYGLFIIRADRGPVDYETFMAIGHRFLSGASPYGPNSYYPLPFVILFAALSALPRAISMAIWFFGPLAVFLMTAGWDPWVLLFAPVFAHFVGGQADVFAVLGLWGFHKNTRGLGGAWLALTLLKPQLALVPVTYAIVHWIILLRKTRAFPKPLLQFLGASALVYIPACVLLPTWPLQWLANPRPLFERAMSAIIPRTLLVMGIPPNTAAYWVILVAAAFILLVIVWHLARRRVTLALSVVWGFVVSPLVHDYDLVQLVPILATRREHLAAILSSLPGWLVIIFMYGNDKAWYVVSFIAPVLLAVMLREVRVNSVAQSTHNVVEAAEQLADPAGGRKGNGGLPAVLP